MFFCKKAVVSVCIPVYGTERFLLDCLLSVDSQSFRDIEIIVVNDASIGFDDDGNNCKKIVRNFKKESKLPVVYIENDENQGIFVTRRKAINASSGDFLFFLDSDDMIEKNAIQVLYDKAVETGADIVHAAGNIIVDDKFLNDEKLKSRLHLAERKINNVFNGVLYDRDIYEQYIIHDNIVGYIWGKLYRKNVVLDSYSYIPISDCCLEEDYLSNFFIFNISHKYVGIMDKLYDYRFNVGITSDSKINSLDKWRRICSSSSVFTIIFDAIESNDDGKISVTDEEYDIIRKNCNSSLLSVVSRFHNEVLPEIKEEARMIMNEAWGEDYVAIIEKEFYKFNK